MLSDREKEVLRQMRADRVAAIKRKRSWRLSEMAMAITEVNRLTLKILREEGEDERSP